MLLLKSHFPARVPAPLLGLKPRPLSGSLSVLLSVLLSALLPSIAGAVKIKLPHGVIFEVDGDFTGQDKKAFSHVTLQETQETQEGQEESGTLEISHAPQHPLGYIHLGPAGHRKERGTLYLSLVSGYPESDETKTTMEMGIDITQPGGVVMVTPTLTTDEMVITQLMGGHIIGQPQTATASTSITHAGVSKPSLTVPRGHVFSMKFENIYHEEINFISPVLIIDGQKYPIVHGAGSPSLPESNTLILMYFKPCDSAPHEFHLHVTRPSVTAGKSAARELTETDLQQLADITTVDTITALLRTHGLLDDNTISTIKDQHNNPCEASFQLLKQVLYKTGNITSDYLAEKLEKISLNSLANRVRTGQLQLTEKDDELQAEMASVGKFLDVSAYHIAAEMGLSDKDKEAIKIHDMPGYNLLSTAYKADKLHLIYSACEKLHLTDLRRQIEQENRFPLLAALLMKEPSTHQKVAVPKILPISIAHLDDNLLRVRIGRCDLNFLKTRFATEQISKSLLNRLTGLAGDPSTGNRDWEVLAYGSRNSSDYKKEIWGEMMPYGKLIDLLNQAETLEASSLARHLTSRIESGGVERGLKSDDYYYLAKFHHKKGQRKTALAILLRDKVAPEKGIAHLLKIKCNHCFGNEQPSGVYVRECSDYPSLQQEAKRLGVSPITFQHKKL